MRLKPSNIERVEAACRELAAVMGAAAVRASFPKARLLQSSSEIDGASRQLPATLLPFMVDEQGQRSDVYAFDLEDSTADRVVVWNDHAVVADWNSFDAFLNWLRIER